MTETITETSKRDKQISGEIATMSLFSLLVGGVVAICIATIVARIGGDVVCTIAATICSSLVVTSTLHLLGHTMVYARWLNVPRD